MTYEQLKKEINFSFKQYDFEYAYGFSSGLIYCSFFGGQITKDQMDELSGIKSDLYIKGRNQEFMRSKC